MINAGQTDKYDRLQILRSESIKQIKALRSSNEIEHELIDSPHLAKQKTLSETDKIAKQSPDLSSFNMKFPHRKKSEDD